jgi:3'-phosphoadenosine 5'-phosphosulfate sulfotransferase (PAPS reductase)/FAD synthetase
MEKGRKEVRYVASVSFGKDSLAMLLKILEKGYPLDEVVFYNTGAEFDCIIRIRDRVVKEYLEPRGIKFTELKPKTDFFEMMFNKEVKHRDGTTSKGYSWCGGACRWGTTYKTQAINKHLKDCLVYVGIASDELKRVERAKAKGQLLPLVEWNMTEDDCLQYCYQNGFNWLEDGINLYNILDRVSCWCCANKNKKELLAYYRFLPRYWNKLKDYQSKTYRPFKKDKTIFDFEDEFKSSKQ